MIGGSRANSWCYGVNIFSSVANIWCTGPKIGGSGPKSQDSGAMIGGSWAKGPWGKERKLWGQDWGL